MVRHDGPCVGKDTGHDAEFVATRQTFGGRPRSYFHGTPPSKALCLFVA